LCKTNKLITGWDEGSAASITQLKSFQTEFSLSATKNAGTISNLVSFVNLGAGIGALLSYFVNDRIGRVWSLRLYMSLYIIGSLASTFSYGNVGALYFGRLFGGLGIGALTVIGPMAIVEIAPRTTRGLMTLWFNICMLTGQMIGVFVVFGCSIHISSKKTLQYQTPFFVQTFVPAICLICSLFIADTPRWLLIRGRKEEALANLVKLRGLDALHPDVIAEYQEMSSQIDHEGIEFGKMTFKATVRETFLVPSNLRRVKLTVMAYLLAQMSGANAITNYLPTIFGLIGVKGTGAKIYSSGLYGLAKVVCTIAASLLFVDAVGRRKSLLTGISIQIFCHSYLAGYLNAFTRHPKSVSKSSSDMAIAAVYIHALGWSIGK
jgi:MFS family permease